MMVYVVVEYHFSDISYNNPLENVRILSVHKNKSEAVKNKPNNFEDKFQDKYEYDIEEFELLE